MGGKSKEITVGYKYFVGMHMAICHGPVDKLVRIRVDKRDAWTGGAQSGRITLVKDDLFGGDGREGGIAGDVDWEPGGPSQIANDYLQAKLPGGLVPAFRGVACAVLRQVYCGNNPYLKPWAFKVQRIFTRANGAAQWQPTLAGVTPRRVGRDISVFIAIERSTAMAQLGRMDTVKAAMEQVLDALEPYADGENNMNIRLSAWAGTTDTVSTQTAINATASDLDAFRTFLNTQLIPVYSGADFRKPVEAANGFFGGNRKNVFVFISSGTANPEATAAQAATMAADYLDQNSGDFSIAAQSEVYCHAINVANHFTDQSALLDNTDDDGVPVIEEGDVSTLRNTILTAMFGSYTFSDMNPAHIIRECLTDPDWGMGYPEADIDETSFAAAAVTLKAEGMGMSLIWDRQAKIEDFIKEVLKHVDGVLYVDRATGLFKLKLIRADYTLETLPVLDESNVETVSSFARPAIGELINSVTVQYWDSDTENEGSVTVQDPALVEVQGTTINTTISYPGFTYKDLAARAAARDLRALSMPLISCEIVADRSAASLNVGDAFRLTWPDYGVTSTVMRVVSIAYGDGRNNRVRIKATEDVFATPDLAPIAVPDIEWENPSQPPTGAPRQIAFEFPYLELVQRYGQSTVDSQLADDPTQGYLGAAASRPSAATINARVMVDTGAGYEERTTLDFCPAATLSAGVNRVATSLPITNGVDLDLIEAGQWLQVGSEIMVVDAVTASAITVKRGALDTVPVAHSAGAHVLVWDGLSVGVPPGFIDGETANVKLLTVTGAGVLPEGAAPVSSVTFDSRAIRPYPPANVQINGSAFPSSVTGSLVITWAHRNRVQQTAGTYLGWTDGSVTLEPGVTYNLRVYPGGGGAMLAEQTGLTAATHTFSAFAGQNSLRLVVETVRDGFVCLQPFEHTFTYTP